MVLAVCSVVVMVMTEITLGIGTVLFFIWFFSLLMFVKDSVSEELEKIDGE